MKVRTKVILVTTAALLLTTVILLPGIIEAKRFQALNAGKNVEATPLFTSSVPQNQNSNVIVGASVKNDTSKPLREMKQLPVKARAEHEANENPKIPSAVNHLDSADPVVQSASAVM